MTKEQQTIKIIREAVPSIMELKMGCKVVVEIKKEYTYQIEIITTQYNKYTINDNTWVLEGLTTKGEYAGCSNINSKIIEILGRPITLDIIIEAWQRIKNKEGDEEYTTGEAMEDLWGIYCEWEFDKTFQEQRQCAKDYIYNLICK